MSDFEPLSERLTDDRPPHEVLRYGITESALNHETALFDVLPGVGKSRSIPKLATIGIPVSIFTNLTDNYAQYERWGQEDEVAVERFPVTTDDCPTLADESPDTPAAIAAREASSDGWPASLIHREFDLPCQQYGDCPYEENKESLDTNGPGILVGHYLQAYNPNYLDGRGVVIDENCFDKFVRKPDSPYQKAQTFIDTLDEFPFDQLSLPGRGDEEKCELALTKLEALGLDPYDHSDSIGEFNALAPLIAYTLLSPCEMEGGRYYTDLPGKREATFRVDMENGLTAMRIFDPPDFSNAEFVIALDATPCLSEWKHLLGEDLDHYRLYDNDQRNQYLREEGFDFIQLNSHVWPASGGNLSLDKCEAYLREIKREHGQRPDLVSSLSIIDGLEERDLGHLWRDDLHHPLRGKNDLEDSELLVVLGSPSRGDGYFEHRTALHGECAQRVDGTSGHSLSYGSDLADDILESTRRGGVFQAAMRAGRTDDAEATVYIATGMIPKWLETMKVGRRRPDGSFDACVRTRSENEKKVIEAIRGADGISASDIAERSGVNRKTAADIRRPLQERGLVTKEGERRWARYSDSGLDGLNIAGTVDLESIAEKPLDNPYKGSSAIEMPPGSADPREPVNSINRYPDWMLDVQRRARWRWEHEQMKRMPIESSPG